MDEVFPTDDKDKRGRRIEDKVFRGAYNYFRNDNIYSEETFDVYKDKKELTMTFVSQILSRVATGELLNINVEYTVNKNFLPHHVVIERALGKDYSRETYEHNVRKNILTYTFENKDDTHISELMTAPTFHITTPTSTTSSLFLKTKKFDQTSKNFYLLYSSTNQWKYETDPITQSIYMQRVSLTSESITIDGHNVEAIQYKLFEDIDEDENAKKAVIVPPSLRLYVSQHAAIPYVIKGDDGTKIQVKYFNDLENKE
jgi:hypothetical protein